MGRETGDGEGVKESELVGGLWGWTEVDVEEVGWTGLGGGWDERVEERDRALVMYNEK